MKWFYEIGYRHFRMPWEIGPRKELVSLVESGRIPPGRAIDLGCGTGSNAIYLAQHGFQVTGVDYAAAAIEKARAKAKAEGVQVTFAVDDLTDLRHVDGPFDFLVDYGVLDDLSARARHRYVESVLPLTQPGSRFLLWAWEWPPRWWERFVPNMALEPGEAERRFGSHFEIDRIGGTSAPDFSQRPPGYAAYLMTRRNSQT
jgi:SAM-dependent methyltransferase